MDEVFQAAPRMQNAFPNVNVFHNRARVSRGHILAFFCTAIGSIRPLAHDEGLDLFPGGAAAERFPHLEHRPRLTLGGVPLLMEHLLQRGHALSQRFREYRPGFAQRDLLTLDRHWATKTV